jgi:hypothetical protein
MTNGNYDLNTSIFAFDFTQNKYPIISKISGFEKLGERWHYGEGCRFDKKTIEAALDFSFYLYNNLFTKLDAFPGLNGEILIRAYLPMTSIEIFIESNLNANFIVEDLSGNDLFNSTELSINDLKKQILSHRQLSIPEWNLLESSPLITTRKGLKNSQASPLETPQISEGAVFPLYVLNAQMTNLSEYANILEKNTQNIPILLSTGNSALNYYQQVVY